MAGPFNSRVDVELGDLKTHGLFKRGKADLRSGKPLIVLIHGTGTNAGYWDNKAFSIPRIYNDGGFDVLNINRVGYGGNPIPETRTPINDSIPLYISLIRKALDEHSDGSKGVVLVGHSLGGLISLCVAASAGESLPLLGLSVLGIIPTKSHPSTLIKLLKSDDGNERLVVEPSVEGIEMFMGPTQFLNIEAIVQEGIEDIFEAGIKSELLEWFDELWYERFVNKVAPGIKLPLQYLAAEYELQWRGLEQGKPIFDSSASLFTQSSKVDARILQGGGHNFEFSNNASVLHEARLTFIESLIKKDQTPNFDHIPLLDFSLSQNPNTKAQFLESLRETIVNVGFFYIKNTSVNESVQSELVTQGIKLLNLPLEEKLKIEMANSKHFLGYAKLGNEITAQKVDYREQFDFATEVPAPGPDEPLYRNLKGPNQWPKESVIPGFRKAVEDYLSEIHTLSLSFNSLIAEALELPPNAFDKFFDTPQQNKLKLVKYPEPPADILKPDGAVQGVGPHQDGSFLTFLLQATSHAGLEIQNKRGDWIPAPPIPGTLVINIGRSLQALTGGVCTATTHRVNLSPQNFTSSTGEHLGPRYSFPIFQGVQIDLTADKIDLQIPQHVKDLVKDEKVRSEAEATFNAMFKENMGEAVLTSRITSHQDVGARWYPDLLEKALRVQKEFAASKA